MIINTTMTSYDVTGLNDNTVYHVSVTASNNAGSSSVTMMTVTNSIGKCIRTLTGFNKFPLNVDQQFCRYLFIITVLYTQHTVVSVL